MSLISSLPGKASRTFVESLGLLNVLYLLNKEINPTFANQNLMN